MLLPTPAGAKQRRGIFYFQTYAKAESYAKALAYPTHRIIAYEAGWAVQGGVSGDYAGHHGLKVGDWRP